MKTVIYLLLAIFVFGIFATAFSSKQNKVNTIFVESINKNASVEMLNQSASIISNRLKAYSSDKFDIKVNQEKMQILVSLKDTWDLNNASRIILQKGKFEFYEAYSYKEITGILKNNSTLLSLLKDKATSEVSPRIGCASKEDVSKINAEINSLQLNKTCKFVWVDNSFCLYALKVENGKGVLLKGSDIESIKIVNPKNELEIKFKNSAVKTWAEITKRNIGKTIAMVLDDKVLSAPLVRNEISGGNAQITGDFSKKELNFLASIVSNGELPLDFSVVK